MRMRKVIIRLLIISALIYAVIGVVLYLFQDKFLFHPVPVETSYRHNLSGRHEEAFLPIERGDTISYMKFFPDSARKGLILYFHGNMNNLGYYAAFVKPFTQSGYEVWMPDYPGFGKSRGKLTQENLLHTAIIMYRLACENIREDSLIVYGKSLGTGLAAYVSENRRPKFLFLETPYSHIVDLFRHYAWMYPVARLCRFHLGTTGYLPLISSPVYVIHGTNDKVIPIGIARKLQPHLKAGDRFVEVRGAGHRNINRTPDYFTLIDSIL